MLIRPYKDGLVMHQLYYANEVRSFEDVDDTATFTFSDKERELAEQLIEQLSSDEFRPDASTTTNTPIACARRSIRRSPASRSSSAPKRRARRSSTCSRR